MHYRKLRNEMTEEALAVELALRNYVHMTIEEIATVCSMSTTAVMFIIEQMMIHHVTRRFSDGGYRLTDEYIATLRRAA